MSTAIYCRTSTEDQGGGLMDQEDACRRYCQAHGITNPVVLPDNGIVAQAS